jgi:two-component system sensor histidine kinase KdpD
MRLWGERIGLYSAALAAVAAVTLLSYLLRERLTLANFTMFYFLLVLVVAVRAGTMPAFVTAFVSFVCINFFLIPPYYSLWIADPREVIDLCVFLIVAAIAGRLAALARHRAELARQRAREQDILYRLTRAFNQLTRNSEVYEALRGALCEDFGAIQVDILPSASPAPRDDGVTHYYLLQSGERIYGTARVAFGQTPAQPQTDLVNTCVSLAAMALERIDLAERAGRSEQFEEADKLKTAILRAVSHDLRTPITIIKTSASNLRSLHDRLTPQEEAEITETIEHEADQLDRLVGNLLDMSRLNAGALSLNRHPNALEEVVGDVAARVYQLTNAERITICFPEDMPLVPFDYGLLLQAVTNLVENALRYEPPDGKIDICAELRQGEAWLKIINHGQTIPDTMKAHIMEPFYHGHGGRTGLGLPIAKGILEAHGGRLWVEDTPGTGATFVLALPLDRKDGDETQTAGGGRRTADS